MHIESIIIGEILAVFQHWIHKNNKFGSKRGCPKNSVRKLITVLQADQQLIETLRHDMTQIEEIKEKLPSLATDCADLHGSLDIFYVNKIMKFDFDLEELDWANKQFLGSGSFAEVFSSELKRKRRPVALKVLDKVEMFANLVNSLHVVSYFTN